MSNLRRAFVLIADGMNRGTLVATGVLGTNRKPRFAIIELKNGDFITEIWNEQSPVKVSDSLNISNRCVLNVLNNRSAIWLPDYEHPEPNWDRDTARKNSAPRRQPNNWQQRKNTPRPEPSKAGQPTQAPPQAPTVQEQQKPSQGDTGGSLS